MPTNGIPLWFDLLLRCVECNADRLTRSDDHYICQNCSARYPVVNATPLLIKPSAMVDTARRISENFGGIDVAAIEKAYASALRYRLNDLDQRSEFTQLVERHDVLFASTAPSARDGAPAVETLAEYFNPEFRVGTRSYRSFRIRNDSGHTFASDGAKPHHISYVIRDGEGREMEGVRSRFPVPLRPGHALTIPTLIVPPDVAGDYEIEVLVVQEFVGWMRDTPIYRGPLRVRDEIPSLAGLVEPPHEGYFDFAQDVGRCGEFFDAAVRMVRDEIGTARLRVLEVACGSDPIALRYYHPGMQVVACDLAFPQVQLAALHALQLGRVDPARYAFAAADVFDLPFHGGSFDVVLVSAALHHFPDTVAALRALVAMLKPGGKLLVLREPGKIAADDPTYIRELSNGFMEQQFELAEYMTMFERAGLRVRRHQMDFECSYKVILEPDQAGSARNKATAMETAGD